MDDKLETILLKLNNIEKDIRLIKIDLNDIKSQTTKMDNHVTFINKVYKKVEDPLHYIVNKFNSLIGSDLDSNKIKDQNVVMIDL